MAEADALIRIKISPKSYNSAVPIDTISSQQQCFLEILLPFVLGFVIGMAIDHYGLGKTIDSVATARYLANRRESQFPRLPWGILAALLFTAASFLRGKTCPGFLVQHIILTTAFFGCGISTSVWLLISSALAQGANQERAARIDQFLSDPSSPVPARVAGLDSPFLWLQVWNWVNVAIFVGIAAYLVGSLYSLRSVS